MALDLRPHGNWLHELREHQKEQKEQSASAASDLVDVLDKAGPPRPGLVPQSGDPEHPYRWVKPTSVRTIGADEARETEADSKAEAEVEEYIRSHDQVFQQVTEKLTQLFPHEDISSRMKTTASVLGNIKKKGALGEMSDIAGFRINSKNLSDLKIAIERIREAFTVVQEKNYFETPKDYYRAYHFVVSDDEKVLAEIQLHTPQTAKLAQWSHDSIYKMANVVDDETLNAILDYARAMSDHYYGMIDLVDCPEVVEIHVGCLED